MILIYSASITARVSYVCKYLFTSILGVPVGLTSDREEYERYQHPKINYSSEALSGIQISPVSLLFEKGFLPLTIECSLWKGIPVLFAISSSATLPFDPFAATFYMITRYEEYLSHSVDHHGRASASGSLAFQNKFLDIPVVEHWALSLKQTVNSHYPGYSFPERSFSFIPTIDVDTAFAYQGRGFLRMTGAIFKNNWGDNKRRAKTLIFGQPDPYDTFQLLSSWHRQYNLKPIYFFLVGKHGTYDKNISPHQRNFRALIKEINENHEIGIHPSYGSNRYPNRIKEEIRVLQRITGEPVNRSRQHFLMLRFPETYQHLIKNGITKDYSMGYASKPGFRAGTCTPFPFYDLTREMETSLMVYPFQVMDGTFNHHLKLSPLEAIEYIIRLIDEVRKVNGTFISLWHNESLSDIRNWHRWQEVYQQLLSYGSRNNSIHPQFK